MGVEDPSRAFPAASLVDTHLHLEELGDTSAVVEQAVLAGVTRMVAVGVNLEHSQRALKLAHQHPEVFAGIGHYPTETEAPDVAAMRGLATDERVVAIGEVGLDFEDSAGPPRGVQSERLDDLFALGLNDFWSSASTFRLPGWSRAPAGMRCARWSSGAPPNAFSSRPTHRMATRTSAWACPIGPPTCSTPLPSSPSCGVSVSRSWRKSRARTRWPSSER